MADTDDDVLSTDDDYWYFERWPGKTKPARVVQVEWDLYQAINKQFGRVESFYDQDKIGLGEAGPVGPSFGDEDGNYDTDKPCSLWLFWEADRRNLAEEVITTFAAAWKAGKRFGALSFELCTGKHSKLEGTYKGRGETFQGWDAFTSFEAADGASKGVKSMKCGDIMECGDGEHIATLVRILKGTKAAGSAGQGKTQSCFVVLLHDGSEWLYATPPNVDRTFDDAEPATLTRIESLLCDFVPKTVTAAIRAASPFTKGKAVTADGGSGSRGGRGGRGRSGRGTSHREHVSPLMAPKLPGHGRKRKIEDDDEEEDDEVEEEEEEEDGESEDEDEDEDDDEDDSDF